MELSQRAYVEVVKKPIIEKLVKVMQIEDEPSWINLLASFMNDGTLFTDQKEAHKIKYQAF